MLEQKDRDQIFKKIFTYLDSRYGDNTSTSFTLRLRELYCRLQQRSPNHAPTKESLQEQMLLGLCEGLLSQTLRDYVCHHPEENFAAVYREALLLDVEQLGHQGLLTTHFKVGESRYTKLSCESDWKEKN